MVRWRTLQKILAVSFVLVLGMAGRQAYGHDGSRMGKAYSCRVNTSRNRVALPAIASSYLTSEYTAVAELAFDRTFDQRFIQLGLNGRKARVALGSMDQYSRWELRGRTAVLLVEVGRMSFSGKSFADVVKHVQKSGRTPMLWVANAPRVNSGRVFFIPTHESAVSRVVWETRPQAMTTNRSATFQFKATGKSARLECRMNSEAFSVCQSPKRYRGLSNGYHTFAVRAVSETGATGPALQHRLLSWYVPPAVEIARTTPAESPTSATTKEIELRKNWSMGLGSRIECRLDKAAFATCSSPVRYQNLASGAHRFEVRMALKFWYWTYVTESDVYEWEISQAPILAEWVSTPAALTRETKARFEFTASGPATFECSLNGAAAHDCTSPWEVDGLSDGVHVAEVVAKNSSGSSVRLEHRWQVDTTVPVLSIISVMPQQNPTSLDRLSIAFQASEPATTKCSLNDQTIACASPLSLENVPEGTNLLTLQAQDAVGNESEPITYEWTVDRTLPTVSIEMTYPSSLPTRETTARFRLVPSEIATFRCRIDGISEWECGADVELVEMFDGDHELEVTPIDMAGNYGQAETFRWTVDTIAPVIEITQVDPSDAVTDSTSLALQFEVSEQATTLCELDGGGAVACASPFIVNGLADGAHRIDLFSRDAAGNVAEPVAYQWTVLTAPLMVVSISVQNVTRNSAVIRWTTNLPARGFVQYGLGDAFDNQTMTVLPEATEQTVILSGLAADQFYRARVVVTDLRGQTVVSHPVSFNTLR